MSASPTQVELDGHRVEILDLGMLGHQRFEYGATIDGVRVPLRVRFETWQTVLLSGANDRDETRADGMSVPIYTPFSNGVGFIAFLMSAKSRRVDGAVVFEHPHHAPGGTSISARLTITLRDGVVELDIFEHWRDENAF